jgi:pyruvate kinase
MLSTLSLVWGVRTFYYDKFTTTDETVEDVNNILKQADLVKADDVVINIGSMPLHRRFRTNMMRMTLIE